MQSLLEYFMSQIERRGRETAALVKRDGTYASLTWSELGERATAIARGLVALGVNAGDRVALISGTRVEWTLCDMGILAAGGVTVPIYPSNLADECQYVLDHSDAAVVLVEDATQTEKLLHERGGLSKLRKVVQLTGNVAPNDGWVVGFDEFIRLGAATPDSVLDERRRALTRDSLLTLIYTSGTTGRPKGVMLTHANMLYEAQAVQDIDFIRHDDVQLLFLPLAHVFAKLLEVTWIATGHVMAFAESINTVRDNIQEVHPTLMCGVPRVFEKFYAAVAERGTAAPGLKGTLFRQALQLSRKNGELELDGRALGFADAVKFALLKKAVFAKVQVGLSAALGGRMRSMLSGGGPLPKTVGWFFRDAGIPLYEGYGLTESSAGTTVNPPGRNKLGTVGPALPGSTIRIAEDGEILIHGPGVMKGYWKDEAATAEVLHDGWLSTGDIGMMDREGYVRITDRKKDIIVTAGGKNVAPQNIENLVKSQPLISQVVVYGDRRKYLSALITLDVDALAKFVRDNDIKTTEPHLHPAIRAEVQRQLDACNAQLASYETIKKFAILERDFSQETGELTPKLSIRRKVVYDKWKSVLDGFYDEQLLE